MQGQARHSTAPETNLRKVLHARGLRYRVAYKIPGMARRTIDIAFTRAKVAVFVDGCFWHRCPEHSVPVKNNSAWWEEKLTGNVARDRETTRFLEETGWTVVRVWEHEPVDATADRIEQLVRPRLHAL